MLSVLVLVLLLAALVLFLVAAWLVVHPVHGRLVALGLACLTGALLLQTAHL